jgi:hypothetical protein
MYMLPQKTHRACIAAPIIHKPSFCMCITVSEVLYCSALEECKECQHGMQAVCWDVLPVSGESKKERHTLSHGNQVACKTMLCFV